jgi:hypothetical protein
MALTAAVLNLVNELFGQAQAPVGNADGGVGTKPVELGVDPMTARRLAFVYFAWLAGFLLAIWLVGFIPAIVVFVFAYMCLGFGEPAWRSLLLAAATAVLAWGLFDRLLAVAWPASVLGDLLPQLRALVGFI